MRQHSHVIVARDRAASRVPPGLSSQAKPARPRVGLALAFAAPRSLIDPGHERAAVRIERHRLEALARRADVIGCGAPNVLPPSSERAMNAWPLYLSSRDAYVSTSAPGRTIFGRASGPSSSGSSVAGNVSGGERFAKIA